MADIEKQLNALADENHRIKLNIRHLKEQIEHEARAESLKMRTTDLQVRAYHRGKSKALEECAKLIDGQLIDDIRDSTTHTD